MMSQPIDIADKSAVFLSSLCVLHCIASPLFSIIVPYVAMTAVLQQETVHLWLLFGVVPFSVFAIFQGYQQHRDMKTMILACVGLCLLIIAATIGHDVFGHVGEVIATLAGSCLLVIGHIKNFRLRKSNKTLAIDTDVKAI